jgi:hypothetical protein
VQQQVLILTKFQQQIQAGLGEPLVEFLRRRYIDEELTLAQVAAELDVGAGTLSRWLVQLGIEARRPGRKAVA